MSYVTPSIVGFAFSSNVTDETWTVVTGSHGTATVEFPSNIPYYRHFEGADPLICATAWEIAQMYVDAGNTLAGVAFAWSFNSATQLITITCTGDTFTLTGGGKDVLAITGSPGASAHTGSTAPDQYYQLPTDYQGVFFAPRIVPTAVFPDPKKINSEGNRPSALPTIRKTKYWRVGWRDTSRLPLPGYSPDLRVGVLYDDGDITAHTIQNLRYNLLGNSGGLLDIELTLADWSR